MILKLALSVVLYRESSDQKTDPIFLSKQKKTTLMEAFGLRLGME
jgi:hypothetical protein